MSVEEEIKYPVYSETGTFPELPKCNLCKDKGCIGLSNQDLIELIRIRDQFYWRDWSKEKPTEKCMYQVCWKYSSSFEFDHLQYECDNKWSNGQDYSNVKMWWRPIFYPQEKENE